MPKLVKHRVMSGASPGGNAFYFYAPDDHYTGIESETGVTKLSDTSAEQSMPTCKLEELLMSPVMTRVTIGFDKAGKKRYAKMAIDSSKLETFLTSGAGKPFKGNTIKSVFQSLDASYS